MCLATPGKIKKKQGNCAWVDFDGINKKIKIDLTPKVKIGDYVIVHAGFSIQKINKKEGKLLLKLFNY